MVYTFLATYQPFEDQDYTLRLAQNFVLEEWRVAVDQGKIPPITDAKINFKTYKFSKYPYQELLKNYISTHYRNSRGDLCSRGVFYDTVEDLLKTLDSEKLLIELRVEVVD